MHGCENLGFLLLELKHFLQLLLLDPDISLFDLLFGPFILLLQLSEFPKETKV